MRQRMGLRGGLQGLNAGGGIIARCLTSPCTVAVTLRCFRETPGSIPPVAEATGSLSPIPVERDAGGFPLRQGQLGPTGGDTPRPRRRYHCW